jgi:anaerobic selenocysteine-containing dehydrogenase
MDMALALAMAHVIVRDGLYDAEFVDKWCFGFKRLKRHAQDYPPEKAADITGLAVKEIIKAARMYAKNRPEGWQTARLERCGVWPIIWWSPRWTAEKFGRPCATRSSSYLNRIFL